MRLNDYRLIFVAVGLIGILLIASPMITTFVNVSDGQPFSELYILDSNGTSSNYPYNIAENRNYSITTVVTNSMGGPMYYVLYVKFGNITDQLPNPTSQTPSPLPSLSEYRFILQNGETWVSKLAFSPSNVTFYGNESSINQLIINDISLNIDVSAIRDLNATMSLYNYHLFFELWAYDNQSQTLLYANRFVTLQLNLVKS